MAAGQGQGYYVARRDELLLEFDRKAPLARRRLVDRHGEEGADRILAAARASFDEIIPQLPDIGGKDNQFSWVIVITGWMVALHRAMRAEGAAAEDVARVLCEAADDWMRGTSRVLRFVARKLAFSGLVKRRMRKQAERSQRREYPDDFVYELREDDDGSWAFVFSECAVNKLLAELGATELAPYCNFFDVIYSRYLDMGLDATKTIGLGCETCTLHYRKGQPTEVPDRLQGLLP